MAGIHEVARAAGITDAQARTLFGAILDFVSKDDANGKPNRVFIKGFGTFRRATMKARTIHSPQIPDGVAHVPQQDVLRFKASPTTKTALNQAPAPKNGKKAKAPAAAKPTKAKKAPEPEPEAEEYTDGEE
jgi:nucleoid DNA-binding protein